VFGTAHLALRLRVKVQQGQTVLVLGASGGVGTAAVQVGDVLAVGWTRHQSLKRARLCIATLTLQLLK
jgi:NADPH2:quinone reductase